MINKDGKVFGKINLLDILIILMIVAVGLFAARTLRHRGGAGTGLIGNAQTQTHTIKFYSPITFADTATGIRVGEPVTQQGAEISFGTITNVNVSPTIEFRPNAEGVLTPSEWGDRVSVEITAELELPIGAHNHGLTIQGTRFAIGQSVNIRAGDSLLFLRISDFFEGTSNE